MTQGNQIDTARTAVGTSPSAVSGWRAVFAFPNPVNEYAARITAGLVVLAAVATLLSGLGWGLVLIAAGFWLRVLFGPRVSPFALLSVKLLAPRVGPAKLVPGPPKRFAQGIGAVLSTAAVVLFFTGFSLGAWILLALLIVAASLESFVGFCLGCAIFGFLQKHGLIPEDVCEACNNIALRRL
ncbi:DUF4395 domain-containing protein [Arthrobacter sp. B2a2-09]|uniref:DUF4395 domain-containing protein n=1 Tax=Arthrobacter sp. B2a2-09 TaxID=2952822 RepID=UPI0022CD8542|nr:DUF4395 domain-containing protein [Arthrobacter sp. B2a2-09]MCZ9880840.1 DUF4395 domain-containing protein [Arthrobacter sp. B2a2-09]